MSDTNERCLLQIQQTLQETSDAIAAGASAARVSQLLYDDRAVIVGEGLDAAVSGRDATVSLLTEVLADWGEHPSVIYTIRRPVLVTKDSATMLVRVDVTKRDAQASRVTYRVMYGFERGPHGWRVVLEMYGNGAV